MEAHMSILALLLATGAATPSPLYTEGLAAHQAGRFQEAVALYDRAAAAKESVPALEYNRACAEARAGLVDRAFAHLELAIQNGFATRQIIEADADLAAVRADRKRLDPLLVKADANAYPCERRTHALDFWVGQWRVLNPDGRQVGTSSVRKTVGGCVVLEEWSAANGGKGMSVNAWDGRIQRWRQNWIDHLGQQTLYVGELKGNEVVFRSTLPGAGGAELPVTMTFTPLEGGRVRQTMVVEGTPPWVGLYVPAVAAAR
jgi:hypothetical protein